MTLQSFFQARRLVGLLLILIFGIIAVSAVSYGEKRATDNLYEHVIENHKQAEALDESYTQKNAVYENNAYGIRLRHPQFLQVTALKPDSKGRTFIAFNDDPSEFPFIGANIVIEMKQPKDVEPATRNGFIPVYRPEANGEVIASELGRGMEPFGYYQHPLSNGDSGYGFHFWTYGTDYTFDVYAQKGMNEKTFLTFLSGLEFYKPTENIPAVSRTIEDAACGYTLTIPAGWAYEKKGCILYNGSADVFTSKTGRIEMFVNGSVDNTDLPKGEIIINGHTGSTLETKEFGYADYNILLPVSPNKRFQFDLYFDTQAQKKQMIELIKNMRFTKEDL